MPRSIVRGALVGLDVGTNGARAMAVDPSGKVLGVAISSYPVSTPRPGWIEQNPEDWWAASAAALRHLRARVQRPFLAVGLTGQMHGAVFLDKNIVSSGPLSCGAISEPSCNARRSLSQ
jgi:xylulokinase